MDSVEARKIEIYAPYYFKIGNIFSKDFFQYSICELEVRNEFPMIVEERPTAYEAQIVLKCAIDPLKCIFRLEFKEERGESHTKGFRLTKIVGLHTCRKLPNAQAKRVLKQRKEEMKRLRGQISKLLEERYPLFGHQPSKVIMEKLALKLDQYPNFLYRGLTKNMQASIKKKFLSEVNRLRKRLEKKDEINYDEQLGSKDSFGEEFVDSESDFSSEVHRKSVFGNFKE